MTSKKELLREPSAVPSDPALVKIYCDPKSAVSAGLAGVGCADEKVAIHNMQRVLQSARATEK